MKAKKIFCILTLVFGVAFFTARTIATAADSVYLHPEEHRLQAAYASEETFTFRISWLGVHAGDLKMTVTPDPDVDDQYTIKVKVQSSPFFSVFHPVDDYFETIVQGRARLPVRYLFKQHEGKRRNQKLTLYDQENLSVVYQKNGDEPLAFSLEKPVHNEYSSFFILRVLPLAVDSPIIVPTFADKKSHAVPVALLKKKRMKSIFGKVPAMKVQPQLGFKGLYSKKGYPDIWLTDDDYRVPFLIKAKILIGSLSAKLVEYQGPRTAQQ